MGFDFRLRIYQRRSISFLCRAKRAILVLPTGKGKTVIAIKSAARVGGNLLVVCPLSLVKQWESKLKGEVGSFKVVSFSQLHNQLVNILKVKPRVTIVDEPKPLKNMTRVFELMLKIKSPYRFILDATPLENNLVEYWYLFRWLKPSVFGGIDTFNSDFITRPGVYKNMDKFRDRVNAYVCQPKVAEVRARVLKFIHVKPTFDFEHQVEYDLLCDRLKVALKSAGKHPNALLRAMGKISKLRSFLGDVKKGGKPKVSLLVDFLRANPDRRGIIFCYKRETVSEVVKELRKHVCKAEPFMGNLSAIKREKLRNSFNAGEIRCLVATSAGERGIDLPTGNLIVHFDLPWTRAAYDQRDRVSRMSSDQSDHTVILTLILKNTVEVLMWSIIAAKHELMVKPFDKNITDLVIKKDSWSKFLNTFIGGIGSGKVNEKTGEGVWFSRG